MSEVDAKKRRYNSKFTRAKSLLFFETKKCKYSNQETRYLYLDILIDRKVEGRVESAYHELVNHVIE